MDAETGQFRLGNLHPEGDYLANTRRIFEQFSLDFDKVHVLLGLSTDAALVDVTKDQSFSVVFIDGDHSYDVAKFDIETYTRLVSPGGFAVIDDAASFLPGRGYFKGMPSVSRMSDIGAIAQLAQRAKCWAQSRLLARRPRLARAVTT